MQVSIDNDELEKKVAIALKGINGRSLAQAILKCIIIKAKEDEILLEATNLEIGLRVKVDGTVEEEGCCAIDGKSLADISRKMPDGDVVIQSDEKTAVISGKKVKIKLPVSDVESFPGLPDLTEMEVSCSVLQGALKDTLYKSIAGISSVTAGCVAGICLYLMFFSKNRNTVEESIAWLKRIAVCWIAIMLMASIIYFVTTNLGIGDNASLY